MARQTFVKMVDDLTREEGAQEHSFSLDGWLYEIDLTDDHWREITSFMQRFVDAAPNRPRKIQAARSVYGPAAGRPVLAARRTSNDPEQNRAIRAWVGRHWRQAGLREPNPNWLTGKGSIPDDFRQAYERHHGMAPGRPVEHVDLNGGDGDQGDAREPGVPAAAFSSPS